MGKKKAAKTKTDQDVSDLYVTPDIVTGEVQIHEYTPEKTPSRISRSRFSDVPSPAITEQPSESAEEGHGLDRLCKKIEATQEIMRIEIQMVLNRLSNAEFATLEQKKAVASRINWLLKTAGAKLLCPKCGEGAYLRASNVGNAKEGAFQFSHGSGKNHGAPTRFPENPRCGKFEG